MPNTLTLPGWVFAVPGLFVQVFGLSSGDLELSFTGSVLLCLGLAVYARRKGYHFAWGLWGVVPVLGALVMLAQRDRHVVPGARMRGGVPLLSLMAVIGLAFTALMPQILSGDYFLGRTPEPPAPPVAVEPVEVQAQPAPAPEPEPEPPAPEPPAPPAPPATFEEAYGRIKLGMTYEEVRELAGNDMLVVHKSEAGMSIIRWESDTHAFTARFTGNKLDMLSGLQKKVVTPLSAAAREEMRARSEQRLSETAERLGVRQEEEVQADELAPPETGTSAEEPAVDAPEEQPAPEPSGVVTQRGRQERVVRIGGQAGERRTRPSVKKARFPRYSGSISRGPHDVVFVNRGENVLRVAVRMNQRGTDFEIRPGDYHVIFVSNGTYSLYYIDSAEPETLHNAGQVTVDTPPTAINVELPR